MNYDKSGLTNQRLAISFLLAIIVFIGTGIVGYRAVDTLVKNQRNQVSARLIAIELQTLLNMANLAETGQRGFVLTGDEAYLAPYHEAKRELPKSIDYLRRALSDSPEQLQRLATIEALQRQKFDELEESITARRQSGFEAAQKIVLSDRGKILMDEIRDLVEAMDQIETGKLQQRITRSANSAEQAYVTLIFSGILDVGLLLFLIFIVRTDMAARQKSAKDIANAQALLTNLINGASSAIYLIDSKGNFILANHAFEQFNGLRKEEIKEKNDYDLYPKEIAELHARKNQQVLESNEPVYFEEVISLGGNARHFFTSRVPIRDAHGKLIGIGGVSTDISSLKQAEAEIRTLNQTLEKRVEERTLALDRTNSELKDANNSLEAFSYTVAHDLRAPLRGMQGFAEAVLEDYGMQLDTLGQDYLRRISRAAARMEQLIDDLLTFSRLARADLHLEEIALKEVLSEVLANLSVQIGESHARITIGDEFPAVIGNWSACIQALQNLIANALKFTQPGIAPSIEIASEIRDTTENGTSRKWVRTWIIDHGIGIPAHQLDKIFLPFERLHGVEEYAGSGIGLAIVAKAVTRMQGHCGVESEVGKGSRFWIELPHAARK